MWLIQAMFHFHRT